MNKKAEMNTFDKAVLFILLSGISSIASAFKGAVFEHAVIREMGHNEPKEIIQANLEYYQIAARAARSKGAEVIVFPEYGIFPPAGSRAQLKAFLEHVPDPKLTEVNPCKAKDAFSDRPILLTLSCLARETNMYLVANMGDIQPCQQEDNCPKDGSFCFNTNVVFSRDGSIIAKYHKEHLFVDTGMDAPPLGKQDPTFETDLGRFATFICFDIVFQRIVQVSHWQGVKAVLFSTMWLDSFPQYSSIQYFQSWSIGNDVPLLAANVQHPGGGSIGSGIVQGRNGSLVYTFNPDGKSKLLIADLHVSDEQPTAYIVTKNGTEVWTDDGKDVQDECSLKVLGPSKDMLKDYRCLERDLGNFTLAKLTKASDRIRLCNNGLCCSLEYETEGLLENYVLGVNNGSFNASNISIWPEEDCFLARCEGTGDKECVTFPTESKTSFRFVSLEANFSSNFVYPSVMTSKMRLPPKNEWNFESKNHVSRVTFRDSLGKKVLVVGLKARSYDGDPSHAENAAIYSFGHVSCIYFFSALVGFILLLGML